MFQYIESRCRTPNGLRQTWTLYLFGFLPLFRRVEILTLSKRDAALCKPSELSDPL